MSHLTRATCAQLKAAAIDNANNQTPPTGSYFENHDRVFGQDGVKVTRLNPGDIDKYLANQQKHWGRSLKKGAERNV